MSKKVTVYSTPTCPYCRMAKEYLGENKIEFNNIDVSMDSKAAQDMIEKSGQMGVPVIVSGDELIVGFDRAKIASALGLDK